jgi:hypothetical protein
MNTMIPRIYLPASESDIEMARATKHHGAAPGQEITNITAVSIPASTGLQTVFIAQRRRAAFIHLPCIADSG